MKHIFVRNISRVAFCELVYAFALSFILKFDFKFHFRVFVIAELFTYKFEIQSEILQYLALLQILILQ